MLGFEATIEAELVVYRIMPVDGAYAGIPTETGVVIAELQSWPQVPPHWLHFPATVEFRQLTSARLQSRDGEATAVRFPAGVMPPLASLGRATSERS